MLLIQISDRSKIRKTTYAGYNASHSVSPRSGIGECSNGNFGHNAVALHGIVGFALVTDSEDQHHIGPLCIAIKRHIGAFAIRNQ